MRVVKARHLAMITLTLALGGCIDSMNGKSISLGDVSLGQQLIDLKAALEAEAISKDEYESLKAELIAAVEMCEGGQAEEDEDEGFRFF